jgi:murein DD-endopeptidase MepM/ murein hydrolase activator NlpD
MGTGLMVQRVTENTVREAPISGQRLQAANHDAGEIRAKALQGFGQDVVQGAEQLDEIVYKFDLAAAKNADSRDAVELARIRAEALSATGEDAPKAAELARQAADQLRKTTLTGLKGRRAKLYNASFDERMAAFEGQITEHSIKQADVAERGAFAASGENDMRIAIDGHSDPAVWEENIGRAEYNYKQANRGKSAVELNNGWYEQRSKAHVAVVRSIMALNPDDPLLASKWMDDHAKEIAPEHEPELRKSLQPLVEQAQTQADLGVVMSSLAGDPLAAEPDDGNSDPSQPTPAVPRPAGQKPQDVTQHLVSGKGRITDNATAHRLRGSGNALDIAAPYGTVIRPPMSGKVIKSWFDADHGGGWSMLIQHPNGTVTGYAHMKSKGYLDVGAEVESTTAIGAVGQTGRASGNHLHFTVRKDGQKVDPQTIDWSAMADSGGPKTVDPKAVKWKEGDIIRNVPDKNQLPALMDAAYETAKAQNWPQARYDRVIAEIKQMAATNEQMYAAQYDDLKDRVWTKIADLDQGTGITSVTQLGGDYGLLEGADKVTVQNMINANKKALEGDAVKPYGEDYNEWNLMARGTPNEVELFLKQDFRAASGMTKAERSRLQVLQADMRNDQTGRLAADQGRVMRYVNQYTREAGFDSEVLNKGKGKEADRQRKMRSNLIDRTVAAVDREQKRRNQPLSDAEIDAIVRAEVVTVTYEGQDMKLYEVREKGGERFGVKNPTQVYQGIPDVVRDRIIRDLQARGVTPTPRLVIETYLEESR